MKPRYECFILNKAQSVIFLLIIIEYKKKENIKMNRLLITLLLIVSLAFFWSCDPDAPGLDVSSIITLAVTGIDFNESTKTADFGTVEVGSSSTLASTIKNTSTSSITIESISNDNTTDYTITSAVLPFTIDAGAEASFSVAFSPSTNTSLTASITIALSTDVSLSDTITLNGAGNYAPSVVFGVTVSEAATYTEINGFYTKQTDSYASDNGYEGNPMTEDDGRPLYKMTSGAIDYFLYYYQNDQIFWGIKDVEPDFNYPSYVEGVNGPTAFKETNTANSFYPPELIPVMEISNWVENFTGNNQITVKTGITRTGENTITAEYQYSDQNGDSEGSSTYKWYIYTPGEILDPVNGSYSVIPGADSKTYEITGSDENKYIKVGVTALDSNGFSGSEIISDPYYAYYIVMEMPK
jgi:hypothetical protein